MNKIPTQLENPNGLHQRYVIKKLVKISEPLSYINGKPSLVRTAVIEEPCDTDAEYFVLRLDEGGKDIEHINACRIGINAYADAIQYHLPELSKDLKERYPLPHPITSISGDVIAAWNKTKEQIGNINYQGLVNIRDLVKILGEFEDKYLLQSSHVDRACPCLYLDEPCCESCTCKNGFSSTGCMYCCTYGSLEQRKTRAKELRRVFKASSHVDWIDEANEIAKSLAEWSLKYPRGRVYPMSKKTMDDELIEIETKAKEWLSKLPSPPINK